MKPNDPIESFVDVVRCRLNRHRALNGAMWSLAIGLGVLAVVASAYILRGHRVPGLWYLIAGLAVLAGTVTVAFFRRFSRDDAAHFVDGFFDLKDSVISAREFRHGAQKDAFRTLDIAKAESAVAELDSGRIRYHYSKRLASVCVVLLVLCTLSAFKEPSAAVQQQLALEAQTLALTETFQERLAEELEALEEAVDDPEERELLETDQLREWVEALETTKDQKEAMRQMANLEKQITRMANALAQKKTEQLMAKAAKELEQEEAHKELAKKLRQQKYREAGKDLVQLKPEAEKLTEQKRELAKLKSAAQRMAAAARASKSKGNRGDAGTGAPDQTLADLMEALDSDVGELDAELDELERSQQKGQLTDADFAKADRMKASISDKLGRFDQALARLSAAKDLQKKLLAMGKKLGQCQGALAGECQSPFAAPGGLKPGDGSIESRRDEQDALVDNGQTTQLKGQKGQGPSRTALETAADGTGVSHRRAEATQREFERQFESFVAREDVPEDVKAAVKTYFTTIHEAGQESQEGAATE